MADKFKSLGPRFYTALALCLTVAGIGGWFLFLGQKSSTEVPDSANQNHSASAPVTDLEVGFPTQPEEPTQDPALSANANPNANLSSDLANSDVESDAETQSGITSTPVIHASSIADTPANASADIPEDSVSADLGLIVSPLTGDILATFSIDELMYNETLGDWRTHDGIDISARAGTAVTAACSGTVSLVEDDPLMGTTVVLDHDGGFQTMYANLQSQAPVKTGDSVIAGDVIGSVGLTARAEAASGAHLHFSVMKDGEVIDPEDFLKS